MIGTMSNYKRKKSRRKIKCEMCTDARDGNSLQIGTGRSPKVIIQKKLGILEQKEQTQDIGKTDE